MQVEYSGKSPHRSNVWKWGDKRSYNLILPLLVAASLLLFTKISGCWFSRLCWCCKESDKNRASYITTKLAGIAKIWRFFLNKHSQDCYKHWVNFQRSENFLYDSSPFYMIICPNFIDFLRLYLLLLLLLFAAVPLV